MSETPRDARLLEVLKQHRKRQRSVEKRRKIVYLPLRSTRSEESLASGEGSTTTNAAKESFEKDVQEITERMEKMNLSQSPPSGEDDGRLVKHGGSSSTSTFTAHGTNPMRGMRRPVYSRQPMEERKFND